MLAATGGYIAAGSGIPNAGGIAAVYKGRGYGANGCIVGRPRLLQMVSMCPWHQACAKSSVCTHKELCRIPPYALVMKCLRMSGSVQ